MPRRQSLTLRWFDRLRSGSSSQPASPTIDSSQDASPVSPSAGSHRLSKAELASHGQAAWKDIEGLISNDWEWPRLPDDTPSNPLLKSRIAKDKFYVERAWTYTPPPSDDDERESTVPMSSPASLGSSTACSSDLHERPDDRNRTETEQKRHIYEQELEEMTWNDRLRTFNERRNAWTGAVQVVLPEGIKPTHQNIHNELESVEQHAFTQKPLPESSETLPPDATSGTSSLTPIQSLHDSVASRHCSSSSSSSPETAPVPSPNFLKQEESPMPSQTPEPTPDTKQAHHSPPAPASPPETRLPLPLEKQQPSSAPTESYDLHNLNSNSDAPAPHSTTHSPSPHFNPLQPTPQTLPPSSPNSPPIPQTLTPTYKPLFPPSNPLRVLSSNPTTYPSIYRSLIERNRTPHLPINLSDVIAATVQGWKRTGLWPDEATLKEQESLAREEEEREAERKRRRKRDRGRVLRILMKGKGRKRREGADVVGVLEEDGDGEEEEEEGEGAELFEGGGEERGKEGKAEF